MDASASLMHRRYRMYTTRLAEADTDLYPIVEETPPRRWPLVALVACSFAFVVLLGFSAAYSQEREMKDSRSNTRYSRYRLPTFDKRNRYVYVVSCGGVTRAFLYIFSHSIMLLGLQSNDTMDMETVVMACIPNVL